MTYDIPLRGCEFAYSVPSLPTRSSETRDSSQCTDHQKEVYRIYEIDTQSNLTWKWGVKKMNLSSTGAHVRLRLRIVKIKGPEFKVQGDVIVRAGGAFHKLSPNQSEWCLFELNSIDEKVFFQIALGTTSCKCKELEGRKRIDFPSDARLLVEGYWFIVFPETVIRTPSASSVTQTTDHCLIRFSSTRGSQGYESVTAEKQVNDFMSSFGASSSKVDEFDEIVESDNGPVARAMQWLREKQMTLSLPESPHVPLDRRRLYVPNQASHEKVVWTPGLTAMKPRNRAEVVLEAAKPDSKLESIMRSVNAALNLDKMYMTSHEP